MKLKKDTEERRQKRKYQVKQEKTKVRKMKGYWQTYQRAERKGKREIQKNTQGKTNKIRSKK